MALLKFLEKAKKSSKLYLPYFLLVICLIAFMSLTQPSALDCTKIGVAGSDGEALQIVKDFLGQTEGDDSVEIDEECLHQAIKRNFFETANTLINSYFLSNPKRAQKAESTVRNAIEYVKNQQQSVLHAFDAAGTDVITISPAFQWAQNLEKVFMSVKFATRHDSPGCIDVFEKDVNLTENQFNVTVLCRIDKKVMKYELHLDFFEDIDTNQSYYEFSSVGRMYLNLVKKNQPSRWRRLLKGTEKIPNMQLWWEIHDKHREELLNHTTFETDEAMEQFVHIENTPKPKKKKSKKSKKAAASATPTSLESEEL